VSNELSDWRGLNQGLTKALDGETAESWHKVHAQLLKSIADAQGRLLAGINEIADRLPSKLFAEMASIAETLSDLKVLIGQTQEAVRNSHAHVAGRLDAIGSVLAERRQVLRTKQIVQPPKRKQRR
jgi:hypothetical protein